MKTVQKRMIKSLDVLLHNVTRRFVHTTVIHCKGHAKWQNIKHIKEQNDRQRNTTINRQLRMLRFAANGLFVIFFRKILNDDL